MRNYLKLLIILFTINSKVHAAETYLTALIGYTNIADYWRATPALTLNAGHNFNAYFGLEGGITWTLPIDASYDTSYIKNSPNSKTFNNSNQVYTQNQSFVDVTAVGRLPLSDIFEAFAKLGVGLGYATSSISMNGINNNYNWNGDSSGFSPGIYMGLGGELKLSKSFRLSVEDYGLMPIIGNNWGNINVLGAGVRYIF